MAALAEFRPRLWSSNIIVDLDGTFIFPSLVNRDYQGVITAKGQSVIINEIGDVTVSDYTEDTDMTAQKLTGATKELIIDQAKYFYVTVDDILGKYTDWEREKIYPPLGPVNVQLMLDELAEVNYIELRDGKAYPGSR